jgi:hypothetical protein
MSGRSEAREDRRVPRDRRAADVTEHAAPADSDRTTPAAHTIFAQPWWLDAVAPGSWGESVVRSGNDVVARLPFVVKERFGLRVLTQPQLTPFLGPWVRNTGSKPTRQLELEKDLMSELIDQLPRHDVFRQNFSPAVGNWLPFYWKGFEASTRYTYRIDDLRDLDAVWGDFAHNVRRHVRKAQKQLAVRTDLDIDVLHGLYRQIFDRQCIPAPVGADLLRRLDQACAERGARTLLFAVDAEERVHAAAFVLHDGNVSYLLTSGVDTELRASGAQSLLAWEAIRCSARASRAFDFAGSMIEAVERFNRGFGARQSPYVFVRRMRRRLRPLFAAQDELRALKAAVRKRRAG